MRGHIRKRGSTYAVVVYLGMEDGKKRYRWETSRTKKEAEARLAEVLRQVQQGLPVEPSALTLGEWLNTWLAEYVEASSRKRQRTKETYRHIARNHLTPALGRFRLRDLRPGVIQAYYARKREQGLSDATLSLHHVVLSGALKAAVNDGLLAYNPLQRVTERPQPRPPEMQTWTAAEARRFLEAAGDHSPQAHALFALALDTGARKGELLGLRWEDVDLGAGLVRIRRTMIRSGPEPVFGPLKNAKGGEGGRMVELHPETVAALKRNRVAQAEQKLRAGPAYHDRGLVFAKEDGHPLDLFNLGERWLDPIIKAAGVRRIRFHDLRHTCATLLLQAGVNPKVVQERLGHKDVTTTLNRYSHVLPGMQKEATRRLGSLLYGPQRRRGFAGDLQARRTVFRSATAPRGQ